MTPIRQLLADFIFPEGKERRNIAERAADTDELTMLGNRRALSRALAASMSDETLAYIFIDADNFGLINKLEGHATGDAMLVLMANHIKDCCVHWQARAFRFGGDEFMIVVPARFTDALLGRILSHGPNMEIQPGTHVRLCGAIGKTPLAAESLLRLKKETARNGRTDRATNAE